MLVKGGPGHGNASTSLAFPEWNPVIFFFTEYKWWKLWNFHWTSCWVVNYLRRHDAHVTSLNRVWQLTISVPFQFNLRDVNVIGTNSADYRDTHVSCELGFPCPKLIFYHITLFKMGDEISRNFAAFRELMTSMEMLRWWQSIYILFKKPRQHAYATYSLN